MHIKRSGVGGNVTPACADLTRRRSQCNSCFARKAAPKEIFMEEKVYNTMKNAGAISIAFGIVSIVVGVVSGVLLIISGGKLLHRKSNILF